MRKLMLVLVLLLVPVVFSGCWGDRLRGLPPGASE
jgi:hypothetical protein